MIPYTLIISTFPSRLSLGTLLHPVDMVCKPSFDSLGNLVSQGRREESECRSDEDEISTLICQSSFNFKIKGSFRQGRDSSQLL